MDQQLIYVDPIQETDSSAIVSTADPFLNKYDAIRLARVRNAFGFERVVVGNSVDSDGMMKFHWETQLRKELTDKDFSDITNIYVEHRDTPEIVPIKLVYRDTMVLDMGENSQTAMEFYLNNFKTNCVCHEGWVWKPTERPEYMLLPAVKRGNDIYIKQVRERLKPLTERPPVTFFDTTINKNRKINRHTKMLYITGTTDPKLMTRCEAWLGFGKTWNTFMTNIRKQFGSTVFIRAWQSQKNGYPHFHAIVYFLAPDIRFSAVYNWDYNEITKKRDKLTWRIASRQKLHKGDKLTIRQKIKKCWKWGGLDVQCVADTQDCFTDLLKYVTRDLEGGESDLTNACLWFFGKQAFGVSRDFIRHVWGENESISWQEPTNADLIKGFSSNSNSELLRVEFYPMIRRDLLFKKPAKLWQQGLDWEHRPPHEEYFDESFLDLCFEDYEMVESKNKCMGVPCFFWRKQQSGGF